MALITIGASGTLSVSAPDETVLSLQAFESSLPATAAMIGLTINPYLLQPYHYPFIDYTATLTLKIVDGPGTGTVLCEVTYGSTASGEWGGSMSVYVPYISGSAPVTVAASFVTSDGETPPAASFSMQAMFYIQNTWDYVLTPQADVLRIPVNQGVSIQDPSAFGDFPTEYQYLLLSISSPSTTVTSENTGGGVTDEFLFSLFGTPQYAQGGSDYLGQLGAPNQVTPYVKSGVGANLQYTVSSDLPVVSYGNATVTMYGYLPMATPPITACSPAGTSAQSDFMPNYLYSVRELLHDATGVYYQDADLSTYINEARRHVAIDTGCLRTLLKVTFPANQESFAFGGIYGFSTPVPTPTGTPPYSLVSGTSGTATANTSSVPMTVSVTDAGLYFQAPIISFSAPNMNISATAHATLTSGSPAPGIGAIVVDSDAGQYNAASVTPTVTIAPSGQPATAQDNGSGYLEITGQGSGQDCGALIVDANGTITVPPQSSLLIMPKNIASVDNCTLIWNSQRIALRNMAFTDFSAQFRGWVQYTNYPLAYSVYANSIYLAPVPNQSYPFELDCIMYPNDLMDYVSVGQFSDASTIAAVKYYAAYLAKMGQQETQDASVLMQLYSQVIAESANRYTVRLTSPYQDNQNLY